MTLDLSSCLHAARDIARDAGQLAHRFWKDASSLTVEVKGAQDFVSRADREVEAFIVSELRKRFPDHGFFGEEQARSNLGGDAPIWYVDPIDGTGNFLRGLPEYCVSIGLVVGGKPVLGVIDEPALGNQYSAVDGQGAWLGQHRLRVSTVSRPDHAMVCVGHSRRSPNAQFNAACEQMVARGFELRRVGSAALGMTHVAAGRMEGYLELHLNPWDVLAAWVLVMEAGGRGNAFLSPPGLQTGNPVLVSTPTFYDTLAQCSGLG